MSWNIIFYERTVTLVTAKSVKLLLCVRVRARAREGCYSFFIIRFSIVPTPLQGKNFQPVVWWKTTRRFMKVTCRSMKSDPLFYEMWPVVLWKATRRFMKSDPSFYEMCPVIFEKRPVVLWNNKRRCCKNEFCNISQVVFIALHHRKSVCSEVNLRIRG